VSDGIYADQFDAVMECRYCEEEREVEVNFDPERGYTWWECPACNMENSRYEDEFEADDDYEEDYE
jgi:hypothetical protein